MDDFTKAQQIKMLQAIGISYREEVMQGNPVIWVLRNGEYVSTLYGLPLDEVINRAWIQYGTEAIIHDWHAQAARIAALEATIDALADTLTDIDFDCDYPTAVSAALNLVEQARAARKQEADHAE